VIDPGTDTDYADDGRSGWLHRNDCSPYFDTCSSLLTESFNDEDAEYIYLQSNGYSDTRTWRQLNMNFYTAGLPNDGQVVTEAEVHFYSTSPSCQHTDAALRLEFRMRDNYPFGDDDFYAWPPGGAGSWGCGDGALTGGTGWKAFDHDQPVGPDRYQRLHQRSVDPLLHADADLRLQNQLHVRHRPAGRL